MLDLAVFFPILSLKNEIFTFRKSRNIARFCWIWLYFFQFFLWKMKISLFEKVRISHDFAGFVCVFSIPYLKNTNSASRKSRHIARVSLIFLIWALQTSRDLQKTIFSCRLLNNSLLFHCFYSLRGFRHARPVVLFGLDRHMEVRFPASVALAEYRIVFHFNASVRIRVADQFAENVKNALIDWNFRKNFTTLFKTPSAFSPSPRPPTKIKVIRHAAHNYRLPEFSVKPLYYYCFEKYARQLRY